MKFKIKIKPKISYYFSILVSSAFFFYFAYKGLVAYLIHRELYGGGIDTLVLLYFVKKWWARQDSNLGPIHYECTALTN